MEELEGLEQMFTCGIFSPLVNDRMRGEIGESIIGIEFVIEKDLTSSPTRGLLTRWWWWCLRPGRKRWRRVVMGGGMACSDRATLRGVVVRIVLPQVTRRRFDWGLGWEDVPVCGLYRLARMY